MKPAILKQCDIRAVAAQIVIALALTACGGGDGSGTGTDDALVIKGPPDHSNSQGASVGVSNICWIELSNTAYLYVETTILDKTSGDEAPFFTGIQVQPLQKVKNQETPLGVPVDASDDIVALLAALNAVDAADPVTREYAPFTTVIDLCDAGLTIDATSVNANVRVAVFNSNNSYENSKCTARDENGLKIGGLGLCQ